MSPFRERNRVFTAPKPESPIGRYRAEAALNGPAIQTRRTSFTRRFRAVRVRHASTVNLHTVPGTTGELAAKNQCLNFHFARLLRLGPSLCRHLARRRARTAGRARCVHLARRAYLTRLTRLTLASPAAPAAPATPAFSRFTELAPTFNV
jgi:hypothetical protein